MVDAGRLTFFGATQDGEFTVGRRRAETAVGGGPYESSTAGQAMITYSHHSIFDTASPGQGRGGRPACAMITLAGSRREGFAQGPGEEPWPAPTRMRSSWPHGRATTVGS